MGGGRSSGKQIKAEYWLSLADCANAFGMTKQGFHVEVRPLVQPEHVVAGDTGLVKVYTRGAFEAWAAKRYGTAAADLVREERLLKIQRERVKLAQAELDLKQQRGDTLSREAVQRLYGEAAAHIRRAIDAVAARFGDDARSIMVAGLDHADRALARGEGEE